MFVDQTTTLSEATGAAHPLSFGLLLLMQVIHSVLKPGGYWIHLGPLLWHWADSGWEELSIEVSLAEVLRAAHLLGFDVLQQRFVDAAYMGVCWWLLAGGCHRWYVYSMVCMPSSCTCVEAQHLYCARSFGLDLPLFSGLVY